MSKATERDSILTRLRNESPLDLINLSFHEKDFYNLVTEHLLVLKHAEYITYHQNIIPPLYNGGPTLLNDEEASITERGIIFLSEGGYTAIEKAKEKEERNKKIESYFTRGDVLIALGAFIFSIFSFIRTNQISDKAEKQNYTIDSLKIELKRTYDTLAKLKTTRVFPIVKKK